MEPDLSPETTPYDAVLLLSFGGPEAPEDVIPFLENVTRGRGIPRERLAEVGEHYFLFGGRSPINDQNRELIAALRAELESTGVALPVYWGNRNWAPYLTDTLRRMSEDGIGRALVITTSAYASWSSCRQYRENLHDAVEAVRAEGLTPPRLDKVRAYFNHPGFVEPMVEATLAALAALPEEVRDEAAIAFVTHSIPLSMNEASGPDGGAYVAQHRDLAAVITERVREATGRLHEQALVYCSRSGAPHTPWLEPDINDHLQTLHEAGTRAVVMVPIGFVSDHMEVIYDLDVEAMATAEKLALSATVGTHPAFVAALRDLVVERAAVERGEEVARAACGELGARWDVCPVGCCADPRTDRPALCGVDSALVTG